MMRDLDAILRYILLPCLQRFGIDVAQHFKTILRLADQDPKCHCYRQTDHPCPRYAYSHRILDHVAAKTKFDRLGSLAKYFGRLGYT